MKDLTLAVSVILANLTSNDEFTWKFLRFEDYNWMDKNQDDFQFEELKLDDEVLKRRMP